MAESDTPGEVRSSDQLGLRAWLVERYESACAIAARKSNADRAGWLEDAAYFKAAVKALDGRADAVAAERERWAPLVRRMRDTFVDVDFTNWPEMLCDQAECLAECERLLGPNVGVEPQTTAEKT